jgi:hypothetical protein
MPFAKHSDVVEHLSPDRANQPFSICILPWRSRCRWSVTNAHRAKPLDVYLAIIAIDHAGHNPAQPLSRKPPSIVEQSIQPSGLRSPPAA